MTNMDRLFGKELSNILQPSLLHKKRNIGKFQPKGRGISVDDANKNVHKKYLSHVSQNQSLVTKIPQQSQIKDIQMVPAYFDECLAHMFRQEENQYKLNNYLRGQSQITQKMRGILLDWLFDLHYKFKMFPETLYSVVMLIDRYLSAKDIPKDKLQLVGTAAFFIAAKYQETYQVPQLDDLVHFAAKTFTKQDIIKMEAQIINELDFDLITITSFRFFEALGKLTKMQTKNFHLAQYVLQLSLLEGKFLEHKPSLVGSAAIYLINKIRKRNESWPDLLVAATGYEEKELKTCARQLCYLLEKAEELPNTKALRKKFSTSQFNEVTRVKLQRRK